MGQAEFGSTSDPDRGVVTLRPSVDCTSFQIGWTLDIGGGPQPPPLVAGSVVFALGPAVNAIYAIDPARGAILWSAHITYAVAPLATDGRRIYAASTDGTVHAYTEP